MIRSLRTGVTGLRTNQLRLDVIGNNIAGVNTIGFKRSRVLFQDALTQRIATGGRLSGSNSVSVSNVGNGVSVGAIDQVWSQGAFEYTNLPTDLALAGDGFFVASSARGNVLTRSGAFSFDAQGYLVTPGGLRVQGWEADSRGNIETGAIGDIKLDPGMISSPEQTTEVTISGNLSAEREIGPDEPASMSTVIYDSSGKAHTLVLTLEKTGEDAWEVTGATIPGDPDDPADDVTVTIGGDTTLTFEDGKMTSTGAVELTGTFPDGTPIGGTAAGGTGSLAVDFSKVTEFGGSTTATVDSQNGSPAGDLIDYGFDQNGQLVLAFSNGVRRPVAQLALGMVASPDGLDQIGDGFYESTSISGDIRIGRAGSEIPAGVISGAIESSNVDLAEEFTDMIVAQRGYQASARVVTTSDELLQETVSLKR